MPNILKRFIYACKVCLRSPSLYPCGKYHDFDVHACVENYINNMETARYYASLLGAKYLNFLQPFNGGGERKLSKFDTNSIAHIRRRLTSSGNNELDLIIQFYNVLWQKVKDRGYVYDLRDIFDNYDGEIYFDQTHCSDIGYDIIAQKIAKRIIEIEQESLEETQQKGKCL